MALTIPTNFKFKPPNLLEPKESFHNPVKVVSVRNPGKIINTKSTVNAHYCFLHQNARNSLFCACKLLLLTRACSDDSANESFATSEESLFSNVDTVKSSSSSSGDGYVALFIRMLGVDNDPHDREQAVIALWKYSLGGKQYVDTIMRFPGIVNLTVNLLKSESDSACEAAAGLLRMISSINVYRDSVAESGAIEEINGLISRSSLSANVKEQSICTLWNLSVDEKFRVRIANSELLPLLVTFLADEDVKVREAAGGVLDNLALSHANHKIMVEFGVIPKLAKLLKGDEESKVVRKEARNVLLELCKDAYNRILVMEEGLVLVPLIGAAAYKSFRPALHSWPSLPDGTNIEQSSKGPSRYGASDLLLGLNIEDRNLNLEDAKMNAVVGRSQQQFLARIGAIETEEAEGSSSLRFTLLPWVDAVARLVLILELEDESAIARAAESIADASINEHMRVAFKEAGAIKHLVQLIDHPNNTVKSAVIQALDKLSLSNTVCQKIEAEGVLYPLFNLLKQSESKTSRSLEMILNIITRILDPNKELKSKFYDGPVNGLMKDLKVTRDSNLVDGNEETVPKTASSLPTIHGDDLLDPDVLARLVDILRTASPNLQRKAASILECFIVIQPRLETIMSADIGSGLEAVFQQKSLSVQENDIEADKPELHALDIEEAGLAVSAGSRLLTRLLDHKGFRETINPEHFTKLLRKILTSHIPLQYKDWVAACLVKLNSLSGPNLDSSNLVNLEVTLHETIPRLIQKIESSFSPEVQESAVLELNRIVSEGLVDSTRAVASVGAIFPLVKVLENGTQKAVEASLAILYNLSMDGENHAAIIAAGAIPVLRRIVLSQRSDWMRALRLLRNLP